MGRRTMSHRTLRGNPIPVMDAPLYPLARLALKALIDEMPADAMVSYRPELAYENAQAVLPVYERVVDPSEDDIEAAARTLAKRVWAMKPVTYGRPSPGQGAPPQDFALDLQHGLYVRVIKAFDVYTRRWIVAFDVLVGLS